MRAKPATRRRTGMGLIAVVATLMTAACADGQHAQTANETPAIDGANTSIGSIQLHDVAIKAPATGSSYPAGGSAEVTAVIVNTGTGGDALVGVSTTAAASSSLYSNPADAALVLTASPVASVSSAPASSSSSSSLSASASSAPASSPTSSTAPALSSLDVPAGENANLGINASDEVLVITGLTKTLFPGTEVQITFTFQNAGSVTLSVPVQLTGNAGGTVTPLVVPSATPAG